jgi:hypothetical protein
MKRGKFLKKMYNYKFLKEWVSYIHLSSFNGSKKQYYYDKKQA